MFRRLTEVLTKPWRTKKVQTEGKVYTIPVSFSQVTLGQYIKWQKAQNDAQKCAAAMGVPVHEVMKIQAQDVRTIVDSFSLVIENESQRHKKIIHLNGRKYGFIPNPTRISFGDYVTLDDFNRVTFEQNDWEYLAKMMCVLFRPVTFTINDNYRVEPFKEEMLTENLPDILSMSMADVNGALLFFSTYEHDLLVASRRFLTEVSNELRKAKNPRPMTSI
jgi:hypothetical protein